LIEPKLLITFGCPQVANLHGGDALLVYQFVVWNSKDSLISAFSGINPEWYLRYQLIRPAGVFGIPV
jgi:hypothetical protein